MLKIVAMMTTVIIRTTATTEIEMISMATVEIRTMKGITAATAMAIKVYVSRSKKVTRKVCVREYAMLEIATVVIRDMAMFRATEIITVTMAITRVTGITAEFSGHISKVSNAAIRKAFSAAETMAGIMAGTLATIRFNVVDCRYYKARTHVSGLFFELFWIWSIDST